MNLTFEGSFSSMPIRLKMQKMPLTIIRPLALCQEDDIRAYARSHQYLEQKKKCPFHAKSTFPRKIYFPTQKVLPVNLTI